MNADDLRSYAEVASKLGWSMQSSNLSRLVPVRPTRFDANSRKADRGEGRYSGRRSHIAFREILRVAKRPAFKQSISESL